MVKRGRKKKQIQEGQFLGALLGGLRTAWNLGQQYKPATKLDNVLNTVGVNTDPNKATSTLGKIGSSILQGAKSLGFGPQKRRQRGGMGQYGVQSGRGKKVIKT